MRRIIDKRKKEKFLIDDNYLNGQAKICGWQASLVYMSLCRHANKDQESFPSIQLISKELAISRPTVIKGLKNLEKYNVIKIQKKRTKDGRWLNNTYILLDKSQWKKTSQVNDVNTDQVNDVDTDQVNENKDPSQRELKPKSTRVKTQVNDVDTKETHRRKHIEGNTYKETHILRADAREENYHKEIVKIFDIFKRINPTINYGHKTNRRAIVDLIKQFGFDTVVRTAEYAVSIQGRRFAPVITTPYQLKEKLAQLKIYYETQEKPLRIPEI